MARVEPESGWLASTLVQRSALVRRLRCLRVRSSVPPAAHVPVQHCLREGDLVAPARCLKAAETHTRRYQYGCLRASWVAVCCLSSQLLYTPAAAPGFETCKSRVTCAHCTRAQGGSRRKPTPSRARRSLRGRPRKRLQLPDMVSQDKRGEWHQRMDHARNVDRLPAKM